MRSITFTSLICCGMAAQAGIPDEGCYMRHYSEAHLAAHPAQKVQSLTLRIYQSTMADQLWAGMDVRMRDGTRHTQSLTCFDLDGTPACGVDCDGGIIEITRQDKTGLTFRTDYLIVGDAEGCGGAADLAEVQGAFTTYRLETAPAAQCEGL